ncbi:MAG TPA: hypothetical protein ENN14_00530 [Chloroflexi bacterium]|nr:hypothetical protein [Chloroflexota bacterium]
MSPSPSTTDRKKAEALYQEALAAYDRWDVEVAIQKLEAALKITPNKASYHMKLAQALSRYGDFDRSLRSLANFLRLDPNSPVANRIEQLFSTGMDPVEEILTAKMSASQLPLEMIGAAIQMWVEFRIALGEEPLAIPKPEAWAAALDYTVRKVNLRDAPIEKMGEYYQVAPETIRKHKETMSKLLDIMPCDYRYFVGAQNPLDKLVEAAELLDQLEQRFQQEA